MASLQELLNAQSAVADRNRAKDWSARNRAAFGGLLGINEFLPVTGDIQSGILAAQDLNEGAYGSAALNALGLLPFVPAMGGVVKKAGKAAKTQYEIAQDAAQKNAALPISEGGLGLPANNTAMDRAKAMGFDVDFQHGSASGDIIAFEPEKLQLNDAGYLGKGVYGSKLGTDAYTGGGVVYPLVTRSKGMQEITPENWNVNSPYSEVADLFSKNWGNKNKVAEEYANQKLLSGVQGIIDRSSGNGIDQIVVYDPKNIRSRFAAFDPIRRNEADILAGVGGASLAGLLGLSLLDQQQYD